MLKSINTKIKYVPQTFPHWTRRKQICQTDAFVRLKVWTVPAWSPEIFVWRKKYTKKFFSQIVQPETKNQFWMANLTKILTKIPIFIVKMPILFGKIEKVQEKSFNCSCRQIMCSFGNSAERFCLFYPRFFQLNVQEHLKQTKKISPRNFCRKMVPIDMWHAVLTTTLEYFQAKYRKKTTRSPKVMDMN